MIGAAGPVGADGTVTLTNCSHYPVFDPAKLGSELGCKIVVVNDMVIKAAGTPSADFLPIFHGRPDPNGSSAIITVSTGVGVGLSLANGTIVSSEGGHPTWQPADLMEYMVLDHIRQQLGCRFVSVEQMIGGKHYYNLYDALVAQGIRPAAELEGYVHAYRRNKQDIGPLLSSRAIEGEPFSKLFMQLVGSVFSQFLRNLSVSFMPTAGIYLTGGVMQFEVVRYLVQQTPFLATLLGGSEHNGWLAEIPIRLVVDKDLGVKGALQLAVEI